jgi:hypothetical protein
MSLNWNITKVPDSVCWIEHDGEGEPDPHVFAKHDDGVWRRLNPVTDALIWATMSVDLGRITEKNVDEWAYRLTIVQALYGARLQSSDGTPRPLSLQDVVDHIGLSTNVHTKGTAEWHRSVHRYFVKPKRDAHMVDSAYRFTRAAAEELEARHA